jgi:Castor and Pollux, part of voltage-gated ion channel/Calcium-activated potassium channel slowpoke-like RCK domain
MGFTLKERMRYRFQRYLSKGGASIFMSLFVVFMVLFILIIGIRFIMLYLNPDLAHPEHTSFWDDIWATWLQMTDPGNMNQDNNAPTWLKFTTILSGIVGVIILSMLIAFITTTLENVFYNFRKGRGMVIEEDQTLILGWNERVVDIIRELILANESEKRACVVILSKEDKEEMDDLIAKRLPNSQSTRIITTTGDYANINELNRVNIAGAKSVILLANCSESSSEEEKMDSDVQSIKSIMAIISCQDGKNELPIIAEIFNEEKRELISFFNDKNIIALDSWDIMGKLLVQTSLTSGLEMVYNEILSFDGCEIYFHENKWDAVKFADLPYHFRDGIPLGVYSDDKGLRLRPKEEYVLEDEDQIVILAEDDSTIIFESTKFISPQEITLSKEKLEQKSKNILILGWHSVAEVFIRECSDYLTRGTKVNILFDNPGSVLIQKVEELKGAYSNFEISITDTNPLRLENLKKAEPFSYDNVIILSQDTHELRADKIDSDTLIILLLLRNIKADNENNSNTKIITQVLNSENQEIITQTDVDDFIISNKLITMILAQLSEEPMIKMLYDDLFSEDGSEIYVKPASLYFTSFPQEVAFADVMGLAAKREEVCLGIRKGDLSKDSSSNFGVRLNLPKDETLTILESDFLVVLSEDEL